MTKGTLTNAATPIAAMGSLASANNGSVEKSAITTVLPERNVGIICGPKSDKRYRPAKLRLRLAESTRS